MHLSLVSIIVPIYNSELFLQKCLDSILLQTYYNLEIILINDGSTDYSENIINEYVTKDDRIIAIHKENGGIGSAYKAAFEIMSGDYVFFVDSDDWLELNAIEELVKLAIENDADVVSFGFKTLNQNEKELEISSFKGIDLLSTTNEEILKTHFEVLRHPTLARLYKRNLLDNLTIFEQNIGIDEMLTPQILNKCSRAVYTSRIFYNVQIRQNSVCRTEYNEKKIIETIRVYNYLLSFMEKNIPDHAGQTYEKYLDVSAAMYRFSLKKNISIGIETKDLIKKEYLTIYRNSINLKFYRKRSLKYKIMLILLNTTPFIFSVFE